ncbi:MAG: TilS substrate-binding domain-containing protein, partial [Mycobacterium sp.]
ALDSLAAQDLSSALKGPELAVGALVALPAALRRRVVRGWLLGGGATGLTDGHIRAVDALVIAWRGQGGVAVGWDVPGTRLFAERRGDVLTLRSEPV